MKVKYAELRELIGSVNPAKSKGPIVSSNVSGTLKNIRGINPSLLYQSDRKPDDIKIKWDEIDEKLLSKLRSVEGMKFDRNAIFNKVRDIKVQAMSKNKDFLNHAHA